MAGLSQSQTLSQQQVLAPQLQQSLQILQAPMLELRNLIQQELCTNPTLEEDQMEPTIEDKRPSTRSSRRNSTGWPSWMKNGAITWRRAKVIRDVRPRGKRAGSSFSTRSSGSR